MLTSACYTWGLFTYQVLFLSRVDWRVKVNSFQGFRRCAPTSRPLRGAILQEACAACCCAAFSAPVGAWASSCPYGYRKALQIFIRRASCDPVGIRTQDPQLRRLLLYPTELPDPYIWLNGPLICCPDPISSALTFHSVTGLLVFQSYSPLFHTALCFKLPFISNSFFDHTALIHSH